MSGNVEQEEKTMWKEWLIELGRGLGNMFMNPLLYWGLILAWFSSLKRIKKERIDFGYRVYDFFSETKGTWKYSLAGGLILSAFSLGLGFVYSYSLVFVLSSVMVLLTLSGKFFFLSAAFTFGLTFLVVLFLPLILAGNFPPIWISAVADTDYFGFLVVMGMLLVIEAFLLLQLKPDQSFPELIKGKRGKWIGRHRIKRLAFIPFITLIPGGLIESFAPWWPLFDITDSSYGLIILPVITGFEHRVRGSHPVMAAKKIGRSVLLLAVVVLLLAVGSLFYRPLTIIAIIAAIAGRGLISYLHKHTDKNRTAYFRGNNDGLQVLGIIPGSPAERLGLKAGEVIEKVNGERVTGKDGFYEALQRNRAFCKLEVRDQNGEIRFTQRAMYQGEHHQLGVLFPGKQESSAYLGASETDK